MMKWVTLLLLFVLISQQSLSQTTYVNNGTATSYTLSTGDSLYIASGTYTGSISCWVTNTKITVAPGAVFSPSSINGYQSIYRVYGSAILPNAGIGDGFQLYNYGTTTFSGNAQVWGTPIFYNHHDAVLNFTGNFDVWGNGTTFQNNGKVSITGNFTGGAIQLTNQQLFHVGGILTLQGSSSLNNSCRMIAENGIIFYNNITVYNSGLLWASSAKNNGRFSSQATIINSGNAILKTRIFINEGHIRGNGSLYITGTSTLNGSVGSNVSTEELLIYTVNRSNTSQIFDNQWGTVYPNASFSAINEPDTTITPVTGSGCSFTYAPYTLLPVQWKSFDISLVNNIPALSWSILGDEKQMFEVERSTNGRDFMYMATVETSVFRDVSCPGGMMVYYRVKAVSPDGLAKYSDIKTIKTAVIEKVSYQTFPNPVVQKLNVVYTTSSQTKIHIIILNSAGQLQFQKSIAVKPGNNLVEVHEAAGWKKGIYYIHISSENGNSERSVLLKQ